MIFVATGTTGFDALAQAMDRRTPALGEAVIVQIGSGRYQPKRASFFRFAPSLAPYYRAASLVVAHGGMGTCLEALEAGKRLVAVDNPDRYDRHQVDLLTMLAAHDYLIWCRELAHLDEALAAGRRSDLRPYQRPDCTIHLRIQEFLDASAVSLNRWPRRLARRS